MKKMRSLIVLGFTIGSLLVGISSTAFTVPTLNAQNSKDNRTALLMTINPQGSYEKGSYEKGFEKSYEKGFEKGSHESGSFWY